MHLSYNCSLSKGGGCSNFINIRMKSYNLINLLNILLHLNTLLNIEESFITLQSCICFWRLLDMFLSIPELIFIIIIIIIIIIIYFFFFGGGGSMKRIVWHTAFCDALRSFITSAISKCYYLMEKLVLVSRLDDWFWFEWRGLCPNNPIDRCTIFYSNFSSLETL